MERTFHILLYRAFHAQRNYLRPFLDEIGLGTGQPKILTYLAEHGACNQREIADYLEIDPAAVSRMLGTLDKSGFITHKENQSNRRVDIVALTEKGRQAYTAWQQHCQDMEQSMLAGFSPKEKEQFADYLTRTYQNFKQLNSERRGEKP